MLVFSYDDNNNGGIDYDSYLFCVSYGKMIKYPTNN